MASIVDAPAAPGLEEFAPHARVKTHVAELRGAAEAARGRIGDRRVRMVDDTAQGGGVSEMLPTIIPLLRGLRFRPAGIGRRCGDPSWTELA